MKWTLRPVDDDTLGVGKSLSTQSQDFYNKVYKEYSKAIVAFFQRQGYSPDAAQDGLQEVYLRVIRLSEPKQIAEAPKAYLLKVATNVMRSHYRKQAPINMIKQDILEMDDLPSIEPSPEHKAQIRQQIEIVKQAVLELSDKQREIFLMHRMDGMTCQQIAGELKIPLRTVQRRLSDAVAFCSIKLRQCAGVTQ
jgi:RNA polymerase sigma factor (sigma-70 family)